MRSADPMENMIHTTGQEILTRQSHQSDCRIAVIVISLPTAQSRRQVIEQYLSKVNLPWQFFEAQRYDSAAFRPETGLEISGKLFNGEVGCFLSHRSLWQEIKNMPVDYVIVLEDDTVLIPSVNYHALFALLRELDIGVIRLETHQMGRASALAYLGPLYGFLYRVVRPRYGLGTGCYALTPRAAAGLYAAVTRIDVPVDLWLERYRNHHTPIYNLFPAPAIEIRSQSTIPKDTSSQTAQGFLSYAIGRVGLALEDGFDQWTLAGLDNVLRERIDRLYPGMAVWPHSELRRHLKKLLKFDR
jgi:glycosyl transferase family 25